MTAASDALARLDDGIPQPGDRLIAEDYDRHCRDGYGSHEYGSYLSWLADQCPACTEGGTGPVCAGCEVAL